MSSTEAILTRRCNCRYPPPAHLMTSAPFLVISRSMETETNESRTIRLRLATSKTFLRRTLRSVLDSAPAGRAGAKCDPPGSVGYLWSPFSSVTTLL
jgi:hypothetical protein